MSRLLQSTVYVTLPVPFSTAFLIKHVGSRADFYDFSVPKRSKRKWRGSPCWLGEVKADRGRHMWCVPTKAGIRSELGYTGALCTQGPEGEQQESGLLMPGLLSHHEHLMKSPSTEHSGANTSYSLSWPLPSVSRCSSQGKLWTGTCPGLKTKLQKHREMVLWWKKWT